MWWRIWKPQIIAICWLCKSSSSLNTNSADPPQKNSSAMASFKSHAQTSLSLTHTHTHYLVCLSDYPLLSLFPLLLSPLQSVCLSLCLSSPGSFCGGGGECVCCRPRNHLYLYKIDKITYLAGKKLTIQQVHHWKKKEKLECLVYDFKFTFDINLISALLVQVSQSPSVTILSLHANLLLFLIQFLSLLMRNPLQRWGRFTQ